MIASIHGRTRWRIFPSTLIAPMGIKTASAPEFFLVSCVIASSPAPAAKRVRLFVELAG